MDQLWSTQHQWRRFGCQGKLRACLTLSRSFATPFTAVVSGALNPWISAGEWPRWFQFPLEGRVEIPRSVFYDCSDSLAVPVASAFFKESRFPERTGWTQSSGTELDSDWLEEEWSGIALVL